MIDSCGDAAGDDVRRDEGLVRGPAPAWVAATECLGWGTIVGLAWGGFSVAMGGRTLRLHETGLLVAPWLALVIIGLRTGGLTRLEDIPLVRRVQRIARRASARPALALTVVAAAYSAVLSIYVFRRYAVHASGAYDLGIFDQVLWSTLHGAPLRSSLKGDVSILGDHFSPVLLLVAPIYLVWEDARCLLLFQTLAIAAGAVPVYLLARRRFGPGPLALVFAVAYLAYAPTRNLNGYDFHPVALVVPLFLAAALWLEEGRTVRFVAVLALAATCQENVPLVIAFWGLALVAFRPRRPLLGSMLAAAGIALFLAAILVIVPHFAGTERFGYLHRYSHLGSSVREVLGTLVTRPWLVVTSLVWPPPKIEYLLRVFGPFAFLPFAPAGVRWLVPIVPVLLQNTLTTYRPMYSVSFQYTAPMIPFIVLGAMDGARGLILSGPTAKARFVFTPRTIALALAMGLLILGGVTPIARTRALVDDPRYARIAPHLAAIRHEASVSAQGGVFSHVSHRHHAYLFPDRVGDADYVIVDRQGFLYAWHISRAEFERNIAALPERGYERLLAQDGFEIWRRREAAR